MRLPWKNQILNKRYLFHCDQCTIQNEKMNSYDLQVNSFVDDKGLVSPFKYPFNICYPCNILGLLLIVFHLLRSLPLLSSPPPFWHPLSKWCHCHLFHTCWKSYFHKDALIDMKIEHRVVDVFKMKWSRPFSFKQKILKFELNVVFLVIPLIESHNWWKMRVQDEETSETGKG